MPERRNPCVPRRNANPPPYGMRFCLLLLALLLVPRRTLVRRLLVENLALRQQLSVLRRGRPRSKLRRYDRIFWARLSQQWARWRTACLLVKPATVIAWHRAGFRLYWEWKSKKGAGRRRIPVGTMAMIRRMATENPTWGAPRVHGELLKLGVPVSERTVQRYLPRGRGSEKQRQSWRSFLSNHREVLAGMDFLVVPAWNFRPLFLLVILRHGRRCVAHMNVTSNPSAAWVRQQLREAFPYDRVPRYLVFDRDSTFGAVKAFVQSLGIMPKQTAYRCPWQNGAVERFNGTLRRELLDHVIVRDEAHLRRLLKDYSAYYHSDRTHLALAKDAPKGRPVLKPPGHGARLLGQPRVGGLHHRYVWPSAA